MINENLWKDWIKALKDAKLSNRKFNMKDWECCAVSFLPEIDPIFDWSSGTILDQKLKELNYKIVVHRGGEFPKIAGAYFLAEFFQLPRKVMYNVLYPSGYKKENEKFFEIHVTLQNVIDKMEDILVRYTKKTKKDEGNAESLVTV